MREDANVQLSDSILLHLYHQVVTESHTYMQTLLHVIKLQDQLIRRHLLDLLSAVCHKEFQQNRPDLQRSNLDEE